MLRIGPVCAMAIVPCGPEMCEFRRARDFSALARAGASKKHSSGGKQKLDRMSKMDRRDIRRQLIVGAMSIVH